MGTVWAWSMLCVLPGVNPTLMGWVELAHPDSKVRRAVKPESNTTTVTRFTISPGHAGV